jgi:hypothetical protein
LLSLFFGDRVFVSEMQAEPWMPSARLADFSLEEQFRGLDFARFQQHIAYAKASRLSPVYFWGVEWWYWLSKNGHPEFWEYAKANAISPQGGRGEIAPLPIPSPLVSPLIAPAIQEFSQTLSLGMRGEEVRRLQGVLRDLGFFPREAPLSGYFGPITVEAVKNFQRSRGIEPLGIVGPKTKKALNEALSIL